MPNDYFVRITHGYEALRSLCSVWAMECEKMVVYEHVGSQTEKVHCHMVILGSRIQKKQLRNLGSQYVVLKGNEYCSFKECVSWETPVTYMTKGQLDPKYYKGFTEQELNDAKERWVEPSPEISRDRAVYQQCFPDKKRKGCFIERDTCDGDCINVVHFGTEWLADNPKCNVCTFKRIKLHARHYVFDKFKVWNMKSMNIYKMLVYTYCMEKNISLPGDSQWGKWM